ncbi:MAG: murF 2 [Acidimicrobiia bacterium]|nr:murF 2 [Acidimicrobiia bacterium]
MRFTTNALARAVNGRLIGSPWCGSVEVEGLTFDSRAVVSGQLFVAIVAERDGHEYIAEAVRAGAAAFLTQGPIPTDSVPAIVVDDTLAALGHIGSLARHRMDDRVVGVTGSVGKTSVKDFVAAALSTRYSTAANLRSLNNELGLPATLANAPDGVEAVVVEMGMRGFGQIAELCAIARPTIGVVTNIGESHLEFVGDLAGVMRAKGELIEALPPDGLAVLNRDQPWCDQLAALTSARVLTFGHDEADVAVTSLVFDALARPRFELRTPWGNATVALSASGAHMAVNAAAAAAVALSCDVPLADVVGALESASLSPWRMDVRTAPSGVVIINDSYNANPTSVAAALDALSALGTLGRRFAVLGPMAELGSDSVAAHRSVVRHATSLGITVIAVGTDDYGIDPVDDPVAALGVLADGDAVLVKGSRVARLELLAERLLGTR